MRHLALALLLLGCGTAEPLLTVDVVTDLGPGREFTRVRSELSDTPFGEGAGLVQQLEHVATAGEDYGAGVRVAEIRPESGGTSYLRVTLLDASGRMRGQRLATVAVDGNRSVTIVITSSCTKVCPEAGDPAEATACVNGVCVPPTCTPENGASCPPVGCASADDCATGLPCHQVECASGSCLFLDACPDGETCSEMGCVPAASCGDGTCDAGSETPCACPADCGTCPADCPNGLCDAGELAQSCPEDCGPPPIVCGDGICEVGEVCGDDCPGSVEVCGTAGCTTCDECDACCDQGCGDRVCNEPAAECPLDCGAPASVCGDTRCDIGESCSADCIGAICGDGVCADGNGESCGNCQNDCGWCGLGLPTVSFVRACVGPSGYGMGDRCSGIASAWTDTADNVAYYPMVTTTTTPIVTGELPSQVITMLPPLTTVAIQSTRNPLCHDSPPLRPAIEGWVFGYIRGMSDATNGVGWLRATDLLLDSTGGLCADGPAGGGFQVLSNPYSRDPICEQLDCDTERNCREANPIGEGAIECLGVEVDYERIVDVPVVVLRYSPSGSPRRLLHMGDRVRVLYESPDRNYVLVVTLTTQAPVLSPVGGRGWVNPIYLRAP